MRYSYEFKRNCVEMYRDGVYPETPDGIKTENFRKTVREWFRIEEACGSEALKHKSNNKEWTVEERYELVAGTIAGESMSSAAISAGVNPGMLCARMHKYNEKISIFEKNHHRYGVRRVYRELRNRGHEVIQSMSRKMGVFAFSQPPSEIHDFLICVILILSNSPYIGSFIPEVRIKPEVIIRENHAILKVSILCRQRADCQYGRKGLLCIISSLKPLSPLPMPEASRKPERNYMSLPPL